MNGRPPPLNALYVFFVAAKSQSFSRAAETLFVSRSAISKQIKILEDYLGKPLFERQKSSVELTSTGQKYADDLAIIFSEINAATNDILEETQKEKIDLYLDLPSAFNSHWFMSRFSKFEKLHPSFSISFTTSNCVTGTEPVNFTDDRMDAAIRIGSKHWENLYSKKLVDIRILTIATPELIGSCITGDTKSLANYNWLHHKYIPDLWKEWAQSAGSPELKTKKKNITFDNISVTAQAALDGLGILPVYQCLAQKYIDEGRVIPAHEHVADTDQAYYFICQERHKANKNIKIFFDWIVSVSKEYNATQSGPS